MADLAMSALAADGKPACAADKYQVIVHIEADRTAYVSAETSAQRHCTLESDACHFPLAATTARRLACDATLVTVLEDSAGAVLNVGRRTRTIPPAIRRALSLRDSGCRFPGCCETRFVDAHHIHHWCDGGETSLDNLVIEAEDAALGLRIDARTAVTRWLGESMDYGFAVGTLMDIAVA